MSYEQRFSLADIDAIDCTGAAIDFTSQVSLAVCADLCPPSVLFDQTLVIRMQQIDGTDCQYFDLPLMDAAGQAAACLDQAPLDLALGLRGGVMGFYKTSEQRRETLAVDDTATGVLVPASNHVMLIDNSAGAVAVTLTTPDDCDPSIYHLKLTTIATNEVTVTPATGNIEGAGNVTFGATVGLNWLSSMMVFFDGTDWWIV